MQTKDYEKEIELVEIDCGRENQIAEPLTVEEVKSPRPSLGILMRIARLTTPYLAFGAAAAAQKYGADQNPSAEYIGDQADEGMEAVGRSACAAKNIPHAPGFNEYVNKNAKGNKVRLGKEKEPRTDGARLKIKTEIMANKAIRKLRGRTGATVRLADIPEG